MPEPARDAPAPLVLINPAAAGGRGARMAPAIQQWLQSHAAAQLHVPSSPEAAHDLLLRAPPRSRVVLVGGDGTLHKSLPALVTQQHSVGLVPLGSGNDTARALGLLGTRWQQALQWALTVPSSAMDLGRCHADGRSWYFASSLAAGFDASVGLRALRGPRWLRGLPRYLWATLLELSQLQCHAMQVFHEETLWHQGPCLFVSVLNTATYGGGMPAVPHAQHNDGHLDAVIAGHLGRRATALLLPRLLAARHLSHPRVHTRRLQSLRVACERPIALAGDGEPLAQSGSWRVESCPGALPVVHGPAQRMPRGS